MKYVWLLSASVVAASSAGCFPNRSQEFSCDTTADCTGGRVCDMGFCVLTSNRDDSGVDADNMCTMFQSPHVMGCMLPGPGPALDLAMTGTYSYSTDTGTLTAPDSTTSMPTSAVLTDGTRAISVQEFSIGTGAILRATGSHPLQIVAWSTLTITGAIEAGSTVPPTGTDPLLVSGPGANPTAPCGTHAAGNTDNDANGAAGAGGGGFQGAGGRGGAGHNDGNSRGVAGTGVAAPTTILGGCPGGKGGDGGKAGGVGGSGGGAIQLSAMTTITVSGQINAGGAGGGAAVGNMGGANGGGGGGGSGGLIGLDAPTVIVMASAKLGANGGGGGAGAEQGDTAPGTSGTPTLTRATGGPGENSGDGGLGSAKPTNDGGPGDDSQQHGGGGGGGGAGFITVHSATPMLDPTALITPAQTVQ